MKRVTITQLLAALGALGAGAALALPAGGPVGAAEPTTSSSTTSTTTTTATTTTTSTTPPSRPPLAYPGYAEQVAVSTAVLRGRINPQGLETSYYFQYGPTTAYGIDTPTTSAGSATLEGKFTQPIAGLAPYTTYHFRVVASSAAGTTISADRIFVTRKIPLALTAVAAPNPVVFGSPLSISGTFTGTGSASAGVVLQADPFPYNHGFSTVSGPLRTSATGGYSFPIAGLLESTRLRVATAAMPRVYSPVIGELVTAHVILHVRSARRHGFIRLYGTVTPAEPGAEIAFERFVHRRFVLVGGTRIKDRSSGVSRFGRTIRRHRGGLYRALVQIHGTRAQISGRSRPVMVH
jgi:hypothetical protein